LKWDANKLDTLRFDEQSKTHIIHWW
jgi:hypothetical protein